MTTQSRNARIAFYPVLAVLVSAVILLGSCPRAKQWFATISSHSGVSTRTLLRLMFLPSVRLNPSPRYGSRKIRVRRPAKSASFLTAPDMSSS